MGWRNINQMCHTHHYPICYLTSNMDMGFRNTSNMDMGWRNINQMCPVASYLHCVLPASILSGLRFVLRLSVFVAFCLGTFCLGTFCLHCVFPCDILCLWHFVCDIFSWAFCPGALCPPKLNIWKYLMILVDIFWEFLEERFEDISGCGWVDESRRGRTVVVLDIAVVLALIEIDYGIS